MFSEFCSFYHIVIYIVVLIKMLYMCKSRKLIIMTQIMSRFICKYIRFKCFYIYRYYSLLMDCPYLRLFHSFILFLCNFEFRTMKNYEFFLFLNEFFFLICNIFFKYNYCYCVFVLLLTNAPVICVCWKKKITIHMEKNQRTPWLQKILLFKYIH